MKAEQAAEEERRRKISVTIDLFGRSLHVSTPTTQGSLTGGDQSAVHDGDDEEAKCALASLDTRSDGSAGACLL